MPASCSRIVVTGIGLVTPVGADRETSWRQVRAGRSGVRWIDEESRIAGAPAVDLGGFYGEPVIGLALRAAREAVDDARLFTSPEMRRDRIGCVIGTSKGGLRSFERALHAVRHTPQREFPADVWHNFLPHAPAAAVARELALGGPLLCPVAACATGLASVLRGAELIRDGACDVVLAGSSDASLLPAVLSSYQRLGVLATGGDNPAAACRPFDHDRSGFVIGEGAAVLVLERMETAERRGAAPYAEWLAGGMASDPSGLLQLQPDAATLTWLVRDVLRRAGLAPDEIDYANLHGTATIPNDVYETRALRQSFGPAADRLACSSLKGALGHLLGAAGSVELALTLLAMRDGIVPPTLNLETPDLQCDLDYTPLHARPRRIDYGLKLSLGFGGHLVAAVLRNLREPRENGSALIDTDREAPASLPQLLPGLVQINADSFSPSECTPRRRCVPTRRTTMHQIAINSSKHPAHAAVHR